MGRKGIDRDTLRQRVLDEAEKMVQRRGIVRSRMSDLVNASGVSRRTFYKVFHSREEIIRGVIDRKASWITSKVMGVMTEEHTATEKIEILIGMAQKVTSAIPPDLLRELASEHPEIWEHVNERRMKVLGLWRDIIKDGQRKGEIRRDVDPEFFMNVLTVVAVHIVNPTWLSEHDMTIGEGLGQVKTILLYGILPREEAS